MYLKVLRLDSSVAESEKAVEVSNIIVRGIAHVSSKRTVENITVLHRLVPVQTFSVHITHFFDSM